MLLVLETITGMQQKKSSIKNIKSATTFVFGLWEVFNKINRYII